MENARRLLGMKICETAAGVVWGYQVPTLYSP